MSVRRVEEEWRTKLEPLVGRGDRTVFAALGEPNGRRVEGLMEVWIYVDERERFVFGDEPAPPLTVEVRVYFHDRVMIGWDDRATVMPSSSDRFSRGAPTSEEAP